MKVIIGAVLVAILYSLFSAVYYLVREGGSGSKNMVRSLSFRIGLSIVLFALLILGNYMGWISPNNPGF